MSPKEKESLIQAFSDLAKLAKRIAERDNDPVLHVVAQRALDNVNELERC